MIGIFLFMRFRHGDMAYFQYERGVIDEDRLRSALNPIRPLLNRPFVQDWWSRRQTSFVASYVEYINSMFEDAQVENSSN